MIPALGLSARVGLILFVAVLTGWLAFLAFAYRMADFGGPLPLPAPERTAALAALVERTQGGDRQRLLHAVASPGLRVFVEEADGTVSETDGGTERQRFPRLFRRGDTVGTVRVLLSTGEVLVLEARTPVPLTELGLPVGFAAGALGTLVALIALIVLHREIRPLARLAAAVDRVDPTGTPVPLPRLSTRAPEIRALAGAFERLQSRLAALIQARMALIGGIQHDVRTFATRLRLRIDLIPDAEERARAAADIADMIALLDDAMLASRAGARELDGELVELAPLVEAEVADRAAGGGAADLRLGGAAASAVVLGDRLALRRIVANLVANAIAYGRAAHVTLEADAAIAVLLVDDEGPGIPAERRRQVLEPFVRLEASRARRTGGAGLGLAVARSLTEGHGGRIAILDAPGGGARVRVELPLFRPDAPLASA